MTDGRTNVVIASSDRLFADAVAHLIDGREGWHCVGIAIDGIGALAAVGRADPDALLVLGDLPRLTAGAVAEQVRRRWPTVAVVTVGAINATAATRLPADATADAAFAALGSREDGPREPPPEAGEGVALIASLTKRERTVLILMARGSSMSEIARAMGLSINTVRTHMQNLYGKLRCHTRLEVVSFAVRQGLVSEPDRTSG